MFDFNIRTLEGALMCPRPHSKSRTTLSTEAALCEERGNTSYEARSSLLGIIQVDLNINVRLNRDRGDLLNHLGRRMQVNDALVHAHLEAVPGISTLTARRLANRHAESLGRHANRSLHLEILVLGTLDKVSADLHGFKLRFSVSA
jgi:hypothetical protein